MDFLRKVWKVVVVFLLICKLGCCGGGGVTCSGEVTAQPGPLVPMGSTVTVTCQSKTVQCGRFSFELSGRWILSTDSCSPVTATLHNFSTPSAGLICLVKQRIVCGLDLQSGYPPDKPTEFSCLTLSNSTHINCSWTTGRETHLFTNYTVTFKHSRNTSRSFQKSLGHTSLSVPRSALDEHGEYKVRVRAQNALNESVSEPFAFSIINAVIPSTPQITKLEFGNDSRSAILRWNSSEFSEPLTPSVRLSREHEAAVDWVAEGNGSPVVLEQLETLTSYVFELRVCSAAAKHKCSSWSRPVGGTTPGTAPSRQLAVWRVVTAAAESGEQNVTVLWKPFTADDYKGTILRYEVAYQGKNFSCSADVTECSLRLPAEVTELKVSAVTSSGRSPPARLSLTHAGLPAPRVRSLTPATGGSSVLLVWDRYHHAPLTGYVVQWQGRGRGRPGQVLWKRVPMENTSTYIKDLVPGSRYNVSLYAEATGGVAGPAHRLIYSKEQEPLSGPKVSIMDHKDKGILIQWEELALEQQRGFITNYTIYTWRNEAGHSAPTKTLARPSARQIWLQLEPPAARFDIQVSASTSAGEGPRGERVPWRSHPKGQDGLVVGVCLAVAIPVVIVVNLLYLKCARRRIRKACISVGPAWLFENLPHPDNSNAIKLLKDERCGSDVFWPPADGDPPLSPIEDVSPCGERRSHSYPAVHQEEARETGAQEAQQTHPPYKPQISSMACEEEVGGEEEHPWVSISHPALGQLGACEAGSSELSTLLSGCLLDAVAGGTLGSFFPSRPIVLDDLWQTDGDGRSMEMDLPDWLDSDQGQRVLPSALTSCLRGMEFQPAEPSPYSPQGV